MGSGQLEVDRATPRGRLEKPAERLSPSFLTCSLLLFKYPDVCWLSFNFPESIR